MSGEGLAPEVVGVIPGLADGGYDDLPGVAGGGGGPGHGTQVKGEPAPEGVGQTGIHAERVVVPVGHPGPDRGEVATLQCQGPGLQTLGDPAGMAPSLGPEHRIHAE